MKQISEKECQNRDELFRLMAENPELPVIPFVGADVVAGDDWGYWMGSWGKARVDEYVYPRSEYAPVIFKSDGEVFDALESCLSVEEFDSLPDDEQACQQAYDSLPWEKAIIVYIELPG